MSIVASGDCEPNYSIAACPISFFIAVFLQLYVSRIIPFFFRQWRLLAFKSSMIKIFTMFGEKTLPGDVICPG
jgi:hypothetical protein